MSAITKPISFARGAPSLDIVDVEGLRAAADRTFTNDPGGMTGYGTAIGYPPLREWIAERHEVEPSRVIVTNGSMQADAFLFDHAVRGGDDVIVERPTYDRTLLSLRERGAVLHPIELQPDGIDTEVLARALSAGSIRPTLAHIIPNFQNPAGYTLSLA
jgi:DNA-binding transcriptional MocR family regulator